MVDATGQPDLITMNIDEAKQFLLEWASKPANNEGWNYDVLMNSVSKALMDAVQRRTEAARIMSQGNGFGQHVVPQGSTTVNASATGVLYDAVWELVQDRLLRPGPRYFQKLNTREDGFSLTPLGRQRVKSDV